MFIKSKFPLECRMVRNPKTMIGYLRKNFWLFFGWGFVFHCLLFIVSRTGFELFPPVQMRMIANFLESQHDNFWASAATVVAIILAATVVFRIADIFQHRIWQRVRPRSRTAVTLDLINYLHCQSMGFINSKMLGKMSQQVNNIGMTAGLVMQKAFAEIAASLVVLVIGLALILQLHWGIGAIIGGNILILLVWFRINFHRIVATNRKLAETVSQIHGATTDTLGGSMNVRAFSGRKKELGILGKIMSRYDSRFQAHLLADRVFWAPLEFLEEFIFAALVLLCILYFRNGIMSVGDVVFVVGAYASINANIWNFIWKWTEMFEAGTEIYQNYSEINARITIKDEFNAPALTVSHGNIVFDKVNFRYDKKTDWVLKNFSLAARGGEHIGIVGVSGSGKSTIIRLLMRLYDINGGKISIDGQNIAKVSLDSLRKNIAFIPQDTALFNRTIFENLRYTMEHVSRRDVQRAAKFAGAHDFIMQQPDGYNTIVGDRGAKMSGGQRQRIAIARAFLQNAPILLVDEATSSLDSETEEIVQKSLAKISRDRTTLIIAHRLSTLKRVDKIIVLSGGKIVETGTHTELLKKKRGLYAKMWRNQNSTNSEFLPEEQE